MSERETLGHRWLHPAGLSHEVGYPPLIDGELGTGKALLGQGNEVIHTRCRCRKVELGGDELGFDASHGQPVWEPLSRVVPHFAGSAGAVSVPQVVSTSSSRPPSSGSRVCGSMDRPGAIK